MSMPHHDERRSYVDILCAYTPFFSGYLGLVWLFGLVRFWLTEVLCAATRRDANVYIITTTTLLVI
jgi:hypothetical protein